MKHRAYDGLRFNALLRRVQDGASIQAFALLFGVSRNMLHDWKSPAGRPPPYAILVLQAMMRFGISLEATRDALGMPRWTPEEWRRIAVPEPAAGEAPDAGLSMRTAKAEMDARILEWAAERFTADRYVEDCLTAGLKPSELAALVSASEREELRWRRGEARVPRGVFVLLALMRSHSLGPVEIAHLSEMQEFDGGGLTEPRHGAI